MFNTRPLHQHNYKDFAIRAEIHTPKFVDVLHLRTFPVGGIGAARDSRGQSEMASMEHEGT